MPVHLQRLLPALAIVATTAACGIRSVGELQNTGTTGESSGSDEGSGTASPTSAMTQDDAGNAETMDTSTTDPTEVPAPTSFASDIQPMIFNVGCLEPACHDAEASAGGLTLAGNAYTVLVDVPSTINGQPRVIPGDPDSSLLYQKLARTPPANGGTPMPPGGPLPAEALDLVRLWIEQGCPP